jgi:hypothetical protein
VRGGAVLTVIGLALVTIALASTDSRLSAVLGGLGLNPAIVGLFFVLRPFAGRLRRWLPPWLPW